VCLRSLLSIGWVFKKGSFVGPAGDLDGNLVQCGHFWRKVCFCKLNSTKKRGKLFNITVVCNISRFSFPYASGARVI
jgi:hypothetical protein